MAQPSTAPTLTRGHKKKERTRRHLLAAAVDVIAERGEGFSISDVVARAEVSNGTFYNYFDDRDELIDALVPELLASFAAASALAVGGEDPAQRFATISALALAQAATNPEQIKVMLRLDAVQRAIVDGDAVANLRQDLAAGQATGRFTILPGPGAIDVVVGALLLAARRIVDAAGDDTDDAVGDGYRRSVIAQVLCSLGVASVEAIAVAERAVAEAHRITDQR